MTDIAFSFAIIWYFLWGKRGHRQIKYTIHNHNIYESKENNSRRRHELCIRKRKKWQMSCNCYKYSNSEWNMDENTTIEFEIITDFVMLQCPTNTRKKMYSWMPRYELFIECAMPVPCSIAWFCVFVALFHPLNSNKGKNFSIKFSQHRATFYHLGLAFFGLQFSSLIYDSICLCTTGGLHRELKFVIFVEMIFFNFFYENLLTWSKVSWVVRSDNYIRWYNIQYT